MRLIPKPLAALHYAASAPSPDVIEHILSHDECDVDPINRLEKATPLHLAVKIEHPQLRLHIVESLLDAGADTTYVKFLPLSVCTFLRPCFTPHSGSRTSTVPWRSTFYPLGIRIPVQLFERPKDRLLFRRTILLKVQFQYYICSFSVMFILIGRP